MNVETQCLHEGYHPQNGEPRVMPIYQSTTYKYDSTEHVQDLFDLKSPGHMYSRISNPTVAMVEDKIAALEGGVAALCTTSGQSANLLALLNIMKSGDHFIASSSLYGGTVNLFSVTMKNFGIDVTYVHPEATEEEIQKAFQDNTKAIVGETISNPSINVLDIEKFAKVAHKNKVPLIIDNTFPTPILCRPIEFGADIVVHSTTKYMDGHALCVGGVIVDSGKFDWAKSGKFDALTTPDDSYHGVIYTKDFGNQAYITKARVQLMRDMGVYPSAQNAWMLNLGLETLALRMERHSFNADKVAHYLENNDKIDFVNYPTLESNEFHERSKKYLPKGCSGVVGFSIKGGRENAVKFIDNLKLTVLAVHVADIRCCVLHPASSTHRQLTEKQLIDCGITPGLVRFSCGCENIDDIIADIQQALDKI